MERCPTLEEAALPRATAPEWPEGFLSPGLRMVLVVLAISGLTLFARMLLSPILQDDSAFLASIIAVMLGSWYGGFRAGLLATAVNAIGAWYLFLRPFHTSADQNPGCVVQLGLFLLLGVLVSGVNEAWHRAKKRLTAHEEFLSTILEATPTGVIVLDPHGDVTFVNSAAATLFGLGRGLLVGRSCAEVGFLRERAEGEPAAPAFAELVALGSAPAGVNLVIEDAAAARIEVHLRVTTIPTAGEMPGGVLLSLSPREAQIPAYV